MSGHYSARKRLLDMLRTYLPEQIDALVAEYGLDFTPMPDPDQGYYLIDIIPDDDWNPRVLVSSFSGETTRRDSSKPSATRTRRYTGTVGCTAFESLDSGLTAEQSSIARDLVVDAMGRCLELHRDLGGDAVIVINASGDSDTGPSELNDRMQRKTSIGQLTVVIDQDERIAPTDPLVQTTTVTVEPIEGDV